MINRQIIKDQFKFINTSLIILLKKIDSFKFRFHDKTSIFKAVYICINLGYYLPMNDQVGINAIIMHYHKNYDSLVIRPFVSFTIAGVTHTYLYDLIYEYVDQQSQTSLKALEYCQVLLMKREALVALYQAEKASLLWLYRFGPRSSSSLISPYTYLDQAFSSYSMVYPGLVYGDTIDIKLQLRYMNLYDKCYNHSRGITLEGLEASFHQHTIRSEDLANKWFKEYKAKKGHDIKQTEFVSVIREQATKANPLALEIFNKLVEDEKAKYT
jgi:hypothetical protein